MIPPVVRPAASSDDLARDGVTRVRNDPLATMSATIAMKAAASMSLIVHMVHDNIMHLLQSAQLLNGSDNPAWPIRPSNLDFCCLALGSFSAALLFGSRPNRSPRLARIMAC